MIAGSRECFARYATDVQTSPAKFLVFFDKCRLQPELSSANRGDVAARSRANNYNVKFFHDYSSARRVIASNLKIERELLRVLDALLYLDEERDGFFSVDRTMIIAEGEIHHRTDFHFPIDRHRSRHDFVHPENSALRRSRSRC